MQRLSTPNCKKHITISTENLQWLKQQIKCKQFGGLSHGIEKSLYQLQKKDINTISNYLQKETVMITPSDDTWVKNMAEKYNCSYSSVINFALGMSRNEEK